MQYSRSWTAALCAVLAAALVIPAHAETLRTWKVEIAVETFARGLEHPWSLVFLPDRGMLVTERPGRLRHVDRRGRVSAPIAGVPKTADEGQGGLLGMALDPDFADNRRLYLCHGEARAGGATTSVTAATLSHDGSALENAAIIFRQEPAADSAEEFGCRLVFDRTGALFVTTSDRLVRRFSAQDPATGLGKLHRIMPDGMPAGAGIKGWLPSIWSIGHRNMQGAAIHPATGAIWTIEHGPRGGDELNMPEAGKNYGWPIITYGTEYSGEKIGIGTHREDLEQPLRAWVPSIAPSGLAFYTGDAIPEWRGSLFLGALAGRKLVRLELDGRRVAAEEALLETLQERIRDVVEGPDGALYVLTDNPEGRILRITRAVRETLRQ